MKWFPADEPFSFENDLGHSKEIVEAQEECIFKGIKFYKGIGQDNWIIVAAEVEGDLLIAEFEKEIDKRIINNIIIMIKKVQRQYYDKMPASQCKV